MTISYDVTVDDVVAFNVFHLRHAPGMRRYLGWTRFGTTSLALISVWSLVAYLQYNSRSILALALAIVAAVIAYRATPALMQHATPRNVRRMLQDEAYKGMIGRQQITLAPDALIFRSQTDQRRYAWDAIERIETTPEHIFIYVTPITALIVPSRAFGNAADRDAFVDAARSYFAPHESLGAARLPAELHARGNETR